MSLLSLTVLGLEPPVENITLWTMSLIPWRNEVKGEGRFYSSYFNAFGKCSHCCLRLAEWFPREVKAYFVPQGFIGTERKILLPWCRHAVARWHPKPSMHKRNLRNSTSNLLHTSHCCCGGVHPWVAWVSAVMESETGDTDEKRGEKREGKKRWCNQASEFNMMWENIEEPSKKWLKNYCLAANKAWSWHMLYIAFMEC